MAEARKLHDRFFKQAKAEGYAARSAYKLKEINLRRQILRRGDMVLDLGCAPGSWVQVAAESIGPKGLVVGVDLKPVDIELPANARAFVGDAFNLCAEDLLAHAQSARTRFDVVLSDMAPSTEGGGGGTVDHFRSVALCRRVLELCPAVLRAGGHLVMKVFEGEEYPRLLRETQRVFAEVKGLKPEASRDASREMFVIAKVFRPPTPPAPPPPPAPPTPRTSPSAPTAHRSPSPEDRASDQPRKGEA
ncbi:MAG: RlmE family RNA methyltransferase [Phycisphaeraceae bacterium]|nr:RlmE family RNA methyltransferase [Phycisphaeraceae bacterium]